MAREFAKAFYSSKTWQECREAYAKSQKYLCENCLAKGLYTPGEIVHHITELTPDNINDPAIALNFDNLRLVCRKCHAEEHGARKGARYVITDDGKVFARELHKTR